MTLQRVLSFPSRLQSPLVPHSPTSTPAACNFSLFGLVTKKVPGTSEILLLQRCGREESPFHSLRASNKPLQVVLVISQKKPPTWGNCYMSFLPLVDFATLCHSKNSLEKAIRNMEAQHLWSNCDLLEFWARNLAPGCWTWLSRTFRKIFSCNFLSRSLSLTVQFY